MKSKLFLLIPLLLLSGCSLPISSDRIALNACIAHNGVPIVNNSGDMTQCNEDTSKTQEPTITIPLKDCKKNCNEYDVLEPLCLDSCSKGQQLSDHEALQMLVDYLGVKYVPENGDTLCWSDKQGNWDDVKPGQNCEKLNVTKPAHLTR